MNPSLPANNFFVSPPSSGTHPPRPPLYDDQCYNALVHHGSHKDGSYARLIRWGISVHGFIDEHTRFIPGVRAHANNYPEVVLGFFGEIIDANHNIQNRIGRLWANFTTQLGRKWKEFFDDLECNWGPDPEIPGHIWLLRYLFLDTINQQITLWTSAWNHRKLSIPGDGSQSPISRRYMSILQHGGNPGEPHLFESVQDPVELYGGGVREGDWLDDYPDSLKGVTTDEVNCPFTVGQFEKFKRRLQSIPVTIRSSNVMEIRGQSWVDAIILGQEILEESVLDS
uniref:Integrase core domain-containing protein n=1 Tax=Psilocybe cubensis TaxID=181762 RepID=A0A8H7XVV8_PSICU